MIELIRPMLAVALKDVNTAPLPMLASAKIDGIRALGQVNKLVSRTLKDIPNIATQEYFGPVCHGLDGELVVGNPWDKNLMQQTNSGVMSEHGDPEAKWYIFDVWDMPADTPYYIRAREAKARVQEINNPRVVWHPQVIVNALPELKQLEENTVALGYEGLMLRSINGPYKMNRSTLREGYLLKVKRFEDSEAIILGVKELETNTNEATTDERGFTKRSSHKAGKEAAGVLGALLVKDTKTGVEFEVGTGFTAEQRKNLWEGRRFLPGMIVCYKHFPIGVKDKPRFPTFKAFRDKRDM